MARLRNHVLCAWSESFGSAVGLLEFAKIAEIQASSVSPAKAGGPGFSGQAEPKTLDSVPFFNGASLRPPE